MFMVWFGQLSPCGFDRVLHVQAHAMAGAGTRYLCPDHYGLAQQHVTLSPKFDPNARLAQELMA